MTMSQTRVGLAGCICSAVVLLTGCGASQQKTQSTALATVAQATVAQDPCFPKAKLDDPCGLRYSLWQDSFMRYDESLAAAMTSLR